MFSLDLFSSTIKRSNILKSMQNCYIIKKTYVLLTMTRNSMTLFIISKCDVEQDIEWPICNQCNSWLFRCGMDV